MTKDRPKKNESTLCTYTTDGIEIKEGDILGYGDNYPCIILYNPFEARFVAVEFGYKNKGYLYRQHELRSYTIKWKIIGNIDNYTKRIKGLPKDFDYVKDISKYIKINNHE